jgi:hypothetical protein
MILTRREVLLAAAGTIAALGPARAGAQASPPAVAPRISAEEAVKLVASGEAVVVDVRKKEAWDASHAEGAVSIPADEIGKRLAELPKDKLIAAYCT